MPVQIFGATDRGLVRPENEDSFLTYELTAGEMRVEKGALAIVADGVGGSSGGRQASQMAVEIIKENYYRISAARSLGESLQIANSQIYAKAQREQKPRGLATTCTALAVIGDEARISHVGDSRAYLLRRGRLSQITEDHTLVNKLVQEGLLTPAQARAHPHRNVIVKALGSGGEINPDNLTLCLEDGDLILLSSDGLHGLVTDAEIEYALGKSVSLEERGKFLINLANQKGGADNITVVIVSFRDAAENFSDTKPLSASPRAGSWINRNKIGLLLGFIIFSAVAGGLLLYEFGDRRGQPPAADNFEEVIEVN
ncbi:MAG: Stp1/IreP family PP2C-type Ser/Thr phosphatase [Deltaproteobacteria bacterium]